VRKDVHVEHAEVFASQRNVRKACPFVSLANCNILCMYMDALVASGRRMEAEEDL